MFHIKDTAITPLVDTYKKASAELYSAHQHAHYVAVEHLHNVVSGVVDDPSIGFSNHGIHVENTDKGNHLLDEEFGTLTSSPNAKIRNTIRREHSAANDKYVETLRNRLGI